MNAGIMERLEDKHLARISADLSVKGLKMVSVVYGMGLKHNELEDIEDAGLEDQAAKKRSILIKWRNRAHAQKKVTNMALRIEVSLNSLVRSDRFVRFVGLITLRKISICQ